MAKYYAGIGSRNTPVEIQKLMTKIAIFLSKKGYTLRSGGAKGADTAFEKGAEFKEIFYANDADNASMIVAQTYHPAWNSCSEYAKKLHARNAFQILGKPVFLKPVDFVICWTPDGCETHQTRKYETGGTGTAISIADANDIRVYNLANDSSVNELRELFKTLK
jgi:hypothetical protein